MGTRLKRYFISGLVIFLPLALTAFLLVMMINIADGLLGKYIEPYFLKEFGFYFRGLSIIICVLIIFAIGFFATNFLGRRITAFFERMLLQLPFFRQVYPAFKEMAIFLFARDRMTFQEVVLVEYPRKGIFSIGFLTNDKVNKISGKLRQDICSVFMPSAPGPLTGFIIFVSKRDLTFLDISVEEAIKVIVSGGVVTPL